MDWWKYWKKSRRKHLVWEVVIASNKKVKGSGNSKLKNVEWHEFELDYYRWWLLTKEIFCSAFCFTDATDTGLGKKNRACKTQTHNNDSGFCCCLCGIGVPRENSHVWPLGAVVLLHDQYRMCSGWCFLSAWEVPDMLVCFLILSYLWTFTKMERNLMLVGRIG